MSRALAVDTRPVPAGVDIFPPLSLWALSGAATYDPATKEITLPANSWATSPLIRVDKPAALIATYEVNVPAGGDNRMYPGMEYWQSKDVTNQTVGDGHALGTVLTVPTGQWITQSHWWAPWLPGDRYAQLTLFVTAFGTPGTRYRKGTATLTR